MLIRLKIREQDHVKEIAYSLYDEYDAATDLSSMARTTGFTCTAAASLLLEKGISSKGILPPELLASEPDSFQYIRDYLADHRIQLVCKETYWG